MVRIKEDMMTKADEKKKKKSRAQRRKRLKTYTIWH